VGEARRRGTLGADILSALSLAFGPLRLL